MAREPISILIFNNKINLEVACSECDGRGRRGKWEVSNCTACDGTGIELTETGEAILELFDFHRGDLKE